MEMDKKMMISVDADLEMAEVTALVAGGRVGMGRGAGVVGGGTRQRSKYLQSQPHCFLPTELVGGLII